MIDQFGPLLLIITVIIGFYMAWNIGANDVANAMGTSVGSKALTLKNAVIIAAILEFSGAVFVGSNVTDTVRKGIIDPNLFVNTPEILLFGMLSALIAAAIWLQLATYFGLPVSTTHSIVGAIIGFAIVSGGPQAVAWTKVSTIVMSWVVSPILGGVLSFMVFMVIRKKILNSDTPLDATRRISPYLVFLVFFILTLVLLFKGLKQLNLDLGFNAAMQIATLVGILGGGISWKLIDLYIQKKRKSTDLSEFDIVEKVFVALQILSACFVAFAHGANDVANAIGPMAAVISILKTGTVIMSVSVPLWVLILGGFGIVMGLATWGWKVILTIGEKITELTPTRGFSAEFGAATTIVIASKLGLPISTTHTLVGSVLGVGMARGVASLNLNIVRNILLSWFVTLPAGGILAILFYKLFCLIFM